MAEDWLLSLAESSDPLEDEEPVWQAKNPECIQYFEKARKENWNKLREKGLQVGEEH